MIKNRRRAKPRGKPFQKGDDLRRGKNGALCNEAAIYGTTYRNCLARMMPPEELAKTVVRAAKAGRVWAIQMIHDDAVGLPTQPVNINGDKGLTIRVVQVKDKNGNGNTGI